LQRDLHKALNRALHTDSLLGRSATDGWSGGFIKIDRKMAAAEQVDQYGGESGMDQVDPKPEKYAEHKLGK